MFFLLILDVINFLMFAMYKNHNVGKNKIKVLAMSFTG